MTRTNLTKEHAEGVAIATEGADRLFASKVIHEAARSVLAGKRGRA